MRRVTATVPYLVLADLAVSLPYDGVNFASDIAFKAVYSFDLGVPLTYALST